MLYIVTTIQSLQPLAVELVRLRRLAEKSGSEVSIELTPLHLPEQLILNFRGTQEQIEYSRYLLHCGEMMWCWKVVMQYGVLPWGVVWCGVVWCDWWGVVLV